MTIGSWTGTGYISLDKDTGVGAYMISGSLNGGSHPVIATGLVTLGMVLDILSSQYLLSAISLITVPTLLKLAGIALFMQGIYYIHMLLIAYVDYMTTNDMTYFNQMCDWLFKSAFWSVVQSYFATWIYYEEAYKAYEEEKEAADAEVERGSETTQETTPETKPETTPTGGKESNIGETEGRAGNVPGRVQSRINIANSKTRYTPVDKNGNVIDAGWNHVVRRHFTGKISQGTSKFTITQEELKIILQSDSTVSATVKSLGDGQFVRIVDTGQIVGDTALKYGGEPTSWIKVFTDSAGNLITTFPIPAPPSIP